MKTVQLLSVMKVLVIDFLGILDKHTMLNNYLWILGIFDFDFCLILYNTSLIYDLFCRN